MTDTIAIALSGGIDSLVAASLLKEQGFQVFGIHFITGFETDFHPPGGPPTAYNASLAGLKDHALNRLAPMVAQLQIPLHIVNLRGEFQDKVINYFTSTYQKGKTPNPCLVCNPMIKFDILLKKAQNLGAVGLSTGHYARIVSDPRGHMHLFRGVDLAKEQSYFLSRLSQYQLQRTILPLGEFTKSQTRQIASQRGLFPADKAESQDICFIKNSTYGDFLKHQPGFTFSSGVIENLRGQPIGQHNGLHLFTIGQRKGINCPAAKPYYVIKIDIQRNVLVVGTKDQLQTEQCIVEQINWINAPPKKPMSIFIKVRYRHNAVPAFLVPMDESNESSARIQFGTPQMAVTPGQGAVFYSKDEVLGGGWIL